MTRELKFVVRKVPNLYENYTRDRYLLFTHNFSYSWRHLYKFVFFKRIRINRENFVII